MLLPLVYGGRPSAPGDHIFVDVDNVEGGATGTQHLIDVGRHRIGTVTGPLDMPASVDRLEGYRRAMGAADLPADAVETADFTAAGAVAATRRLLDRAPDLDGIFVASDIMATGVLSVLRERGRSCPATSPWSASTTVPRRPPRRSR